ncbi:MAG: DUF1549 domain-containing protein [Planctomycetota bacterium]|nr:DUF1549 domain-containing protein [Planctomycetota bacterium]
MAPDSILSRFRTPRVAGSLTLLAVAGLFALVQAVSGQPIVDGQQHRVDSQAGANTDAAELDSWFQTFWNQEQITPAPPANDLAVLRRLSLALHGTVPSLKEIRHFQADSGGQKLQRWTQKLLDDNRFAPYFSQRLERVLIGTEKGEFLVFKRERFGVWLSEQLAANRPWDQIVAELVAADGVPTGQPATNFITSAHVDDEIDEQQLAGRTIRVFLGQRIDCAQCHDHLFDPRWKQSHFQGLAAFYAPTRFTSHGVDDDHGLQFEVIDHESNTSRVIEPAVPFGSEWLPTDGTPRQKLAAWLTDRRNKRFDRAIVNRVWGQMFGRPFYSPVDDLPDPGDPATEVLDLLADGFRQHDREFKWLIRTIATSRPFRLDSRILNADATELPLEDIQHYQEAWAVFPLVRLRPEQVIGAMLQSASIKTIERNSHLFIRAQRFFGEQDFVADYGDLGPEELSDQTGTIPQSLLKMNGRLARELIQPGTFAATSAIARATVGNDTLCLVTCFEVCLGRHPEPEESDVLLPWLTDTRAAQREQAVEDIFWTLFNSPEFSWNH